jgi:periplasmic divalent cation tolerance protein
MFGYCQLWLTCKDKAEADKIATILFDKKLIACAKQVSVNSKYLWKGKLESESEVLLMMESREDLFEETEKEVGKIHSYDTYVLNTTPITKISAKARKWLEDSLVTNKKL